ncbi:MAG: hypothetical protein GOVbin3205_40 [Prokaryotic dsDNA virus sp.]|nr:MAG: hypothetical protein GOVbin3205_40 [Prokaryotic dsDNA virus sp.]|tara:strand:- start:47439 stop:47675 length:237 start_codon:yes stop_codon:yes gene_type:complete
MKDNKRIAEFMEVDGYLSLSQMQYHNSWDWLMPVVAKCLDTYHIQQMNDDIHFKFYDCIGNIESTYKAVVEFINQLDN